MILQALVDYYEELAKRGEIARPGWGSVKVSFALELDESGTLVRIVPLSSPSPDGKKMVAQVRKLPALGEQKGNGIKPNFLWENSAYLLGFDGKGKPERAKECFAAAKKLHLSLLSDVDDPFVRAICGFFESWDPDKATADPVFEDCLDNLQKGANLVFRFEGKFPDENDALCRAWQMHYDGRGNGETMRCLVTGEEVVPAKIHPAIKNVMGAQSSGAALVSFNASAFCSYEREQNLNAPVGKYAAFAYTTALNTLLADREHVRRFGDTTVVFWAENAESAYQTAFAGFLDGGGDKLTNDELQSCMDALAKGECPHFEGVPLHPENRFYILGLAPNAARLSVRFFLRDSFGSFAGNVRKHYDDIAIVSGNRSKWDAIPLWALLLETVKDDKTKSIAERMKKLPPHLAGDTVSSILSGGRYPATLYCQALLRIKTEREVTQGRAGIIKAYLLRNTDQPEYKEAAKVSLNEQCEAEPYVLGRLFSLLESIQNSATGATTVKDSFFSSACATPAVAFPQLLKLKKSHMKVLKREKPGLAVTLDAQVGELMDKLGCKFPKHLLLPEQGEFMLGYYHQRQKRFEKKDKADAAEPIKEEN